MVELDAQDIRFIESHIKERGGIDKAIQVVLKELDATLVLPDGGRPRQTNSYVWQRSDAEFAYLLNKAMDNGMTNEEYAKVMEQYGEVLKKNELFELENPPIVYMFCRHNMPLICPAKRCYRYSSCRHLCREYEE